MSKTVSILGCGWMGLPLARHLTERGFQVHGSTTSKGKIPALEKSGIIAHHLVCEPLLRGEGLKEFFESKVLFINIPFRRDLKDPRYYLEQVRSVSSFAARAQVDLVLFASSTSVYPKNIKMAREDDVFDPDNPRSKTLKQIESELLSSPHFDATVIRFAGLYGGDRVIGKFLSGKREVPDPESPVNLIHLEDCIGIVSRLIEEDIRGEILNACSDGHPTRKRLYTQAALKRSLDPPRFSVKRTDSGKIVSNKKLKDLLNYSFKHPDPLADLSS